MLALIDWQLFCTFTWRSGQLGSVAKRDGDLWTFLKWFSKPRAVGEFRQVPVAVRWERGELGDRPHAHCLVAGLRPEFVNITTCFAAMHEWNQRHGLARVRRYGLNGTKRGESSYLMKGFSVSRADSYEAGKFDQADRLEITPAAWQLLASCTGSPQAKQHPTT